MRVRPARLTSSSLLARNATLNLVTEGWIFLVLIVAMPKLVTFLGETSFGLFSLAWVVIGYLSFLDIGVNRAATKFVSDHLAEQDPDTIHKLVRTALVSNLALGLAGGLAVVLASPYLSHSVFKVSGDLRNQALLTFYGVGLAVPVLLMQGVFRAVLSSYQRFGRINAVNALVTMVQWGVAGVLAWTGHGVALIVFSTVIARMLAAAAYGAMVFHLLPDLRLFRTRSLHGLSKLLRFGGWVSISQLVSPILVYLDRVLIASFVSLAAVTLYTVPYEVMTRLRIIPSSLVGTLYPAFSERGGESQKVQLQRLYEGSVRYLLLVLVPGILFLFVLGPDLLGVWMGSSFAKQTSAVLEILAVGVLANALAYVPYNLLQALGRPDLPGKFHLAELPLYVFLCAALIPRWGIAGAAFASTIRLVLDSALLFWATGKYCQCSLGNFWVSAFPRILTLGCVLGIALYAIRLVFNSPWARLGLGVLAVGICLLATWVFIVDNREKPRISGVLRMLLGQSAV
ncbi:MAG TPA: flippase [Candidatus Acidoferrales bacterium]|nr:flippase [Candidatus Acidoferrales bacterium]